MVTEVRVSESGAERRLLAGHLCGEKTEKPESEGAFQTQTLLDTVCTRPVFLNRGTMYPQGSFIGLRGFLRKAFICLLFKALVKMGMSLF